VTRYIDFHGANPSIANLFENLVNLRIGGAGSTDNMPHSGQHNTFWNIEAGAPNPWDDMFTSGLYNYSSYAGPYTNSHLHQLFPASLLVGIVRPGGTITVDGSTANRDNGWLYVDSVGAKVAPGSLYQFQRRQHDSRLDFLRWKQEAGVPANAPDSTVLPGKTRSILHDWATGEAPPTAQVLAGGTVRFSFPVRTGDILLRSRLETNEDLAGPWDKVPGEDMFLQPAQLEGFSFLELDVLPGNPRGFFRGVFWRSEP